MRSFWPLIVPVVVFAVVWYFVEGEFIFKKENNKAPSASQPAETQPLPIEAAEVETEAPPEATDAEAMSLPAVDSFPAQVAATESQPVK